MRKVLRGVVTLLAVAFALYVLDWNENDSPWGRDVKAHKRELLKKELCQ